MSKCKRCRRRRSLHPPGMHVLSWENFLLLQSAGATLRSLVPCRITLYGHELVDPDM